FFQAEDGIRDFHVTGVQTCALPIFFLTFTSDVKFSVLFICPLLSCFLSSKYPFSIKLSCSFHDLNTTIFLYLGQSSVMILQLPRSEERRVGKECRSRWAWYE